MLWKRALHSVGRALQRFSNESGGPRIGLALGGGFARGVAHIGVIRALERHQIPIHAIAGVSAGSVVAAAYAAGMNSDELEELAKSVKFRNVAQWTINWMGMLDSSRMDAFLRRALKVQRFEQARLPLAVVASDLRTGQPAVFQKYGDIVAPVRASCAYPGLFKPVEHQDKVLVDGMVAMEVPAKPLLDMGATRILAVQLPGNTDLQDPTNLMQVVNRCFQIMSSRMAHDWQRYADLVVAPQVGENAWDSFDNVRGMIEAGERAVELSLPEIREWLRVEPERAAAEPLRQHE